MKKIIIALCLFLINLYSFDLKKSDFATFCNFISYSLNKNIVIAKDVDTKFSVFILKTICQKKI
ncbi:hypothetical protein CMTB2_04102 [Caminibacter mediatlanticus TB-2]|uniref:Uncharacterized protein n=1 Tax=Caminibacter mediatlanticus TB-2 TaxID=391592 RepID=A0AAI9AFU6_9BACT|nr:hypothetical protein CMTB2_04102 [Caminibacter mediatlanticus TB-2]